MSARRAFSLCGLMAILIVFPIFLSLDSKDWDTEYQKLSNRIEQCFSEPKGEPGQLEPYLRWMETKARDREEVRALLEEAKSFSQKNSDDEVAKIWVNKFSDLLRWARAQAKIQSMEQFYVICASGTQNFRRPQTGC